ncbi:MAG: OmpA family protein [Bernardetiaceae bacterium]|nr:OmpA family protein [Bernardetiaceae bacterium]
MLTIRNKLSVVLLIIVTLFISACSSSKPASVAYKELMEVIRELDKNNELLKDKITTVVEKNENSPAKDLLSEVNKNEELIKETRRKVELQAQKRRTSKSRKDNINKLNEAASTVKQIQGNIHNLDAAFEARKEEVLASDVSFDVGSYQLKEYAYARLQEIITDLEKQILDWDSKEQGTYKEDTKKIVIRITGHTDLIGSPNVSKRIKVNQALSEKRATQVADYLEKELSKLSANYSIDAVINSKGVGEKLPPGLVDDGSIDNPKRRVSIIQAIVYMEIMH